MRLWRETGGKSKLQQICKNRNECNKILIFPSVNQNFPPQKCKAKIKRKPCKRQLARDFLVAGEGLEPPTSGL